MSTLKSGINHAYNGLDLGQRPVISFEMHCPCDVIPEKKRLHYV